MVNASTHLLGLFIEDHNLQVHRVSISRQWSIPEYTR